MFGLGLIEILLIIIVIILVIKPSDYPKLIRKTAHSFKTLTELKQRLTREINMLDIGEDPLEKK